ncbi:MAG: type II toxin-antitoxin system VapC family toxin [Pseudonocardia sp.]|nr:type II toxin-antitoxin system VapC family toxin [Pseudonocardia sp.]
MIYIDTSAFVKLVVDEEPWTPELRTMLDDADAPLVSSVLLQVETRRALQRVSPQRLPRADLLLDTVEQAEISSAIIGSASRLPGPALRSLDAIHLATALLLRSELDVLISYDDRLLEAAVEHSLSVVSPGLDR